jgi:hypothetical protein
MHYQSSEQLFYYAQVNDAANTALSPPSVN